MTDQKAFVAAMGWREVDEPDWLFGEAAMVWRIVSAYDAALPKPEGEAMPSHWHNGAGQLVTNAEREAWRDTPDEDMIGRFDEPLYLHPAPDAREAGLRNIRTIIEEWREGKPTGASDFAMGRITAILINLLSPAPVGEKVETDGSEREIDWNEPASRSP